MGKTIATKNIYEKLQEMRVALQEMKIKKSGINKFVGYTYYELADILPPINKLQAEYKTCSFINFTNEIAVLKIINSQAPDEQIEFTSPMAEMVVKGGQAIQNLGGVETYQRRYLYMTAFEIVENDFFDSIQGLKKSLREELNLMIKDYSNLSGKTISEITQELIKNVGSDLKNISLYEAKLVLKLLKEKIQKLTDKKE